MGDSQAVGAAAAAALGVEESSSEFGGGCHQPVRRAERLDEA